MAILIQVSSSISILDSGSTIGHKTYRVESKMSTKFCELKDHVVVLSVYSKRAVKFGWEVQLHPMALS